MRPVVVTLMNPAGHRPRIVFAADLTENERERDEGLSFRAVITRPMLFEHWNTRRPIWTFDRMLAPIDIISIDDHGFVRELLPSIAPRSPMMRLGDYPVSLVIEAPHGFIARNDVRVGTRLLSVL